MNETNGEIKIEKGVPIPKTLGRGRTKYPFKHMGVGDSFVVLKPRQQVSIFLPAYNHRLKPKHFVCASECADKTRVWRVE